MAGVRLCGRLCYGKEYNNKNVSDTCTSGIFVVVIVAVEHINDIQSETVMSNRHDKNRTNAVNNSQRVICK